MLINLIKKIKKNETSIANGAIISILGKVISALFGYINMVLIARILKPHDFGIYNYSFSILFFCYTLSNFGLENTLLSRLPKRKKAGESEYLVTVFSSFLSVIVISTLVSVILIFSEPSLEYYSGIKDLGKVLDILICTIPIQTLILLMRVINQNNFKFFGVTFPEFIFKPICYFILLIFLLYFNLDSYKYVLWSYVVLLLFILLISIRWVVLSLQPLNKSVKAKIDLKYFILASQFFFYDFLYSFGPLLITLIMGHYLNSKEIGYYKASEQTATLTVFVLNSINTVFAPMISKLYSNGDSVRLNNVYKMATKYTFAVGGIIGIVVLICSSVILSAFGSEFKSAGIILQLLVLGQIVNAATGSCGYMLMMTGNQKIMIWITLGQMCLNPVISWFLLSNYGLIGAALSSCLGMIISNICLTYVVWRKVKAHPISKGYAGTLISLVIAYITTSWLFKYLINLNFVSQILITGIFTSFVFGALFLFIGLDIDDKNLIKLQIDKFLNRFKESA